MVLAARLLVILTVLRRYFYLRTAQIRDVVLPADKDASITRECMRRLLGLGFVRRYEPKLIDGQTGTAPPVYALTLQGACALAQQIGDCSLGLAFEPNFRMNWSRQARSPGEAGLHGISPWLSPRRNAFAASFSAAMV